MPGPGIRVLMEVKQKAGGAHECGTQSSRGTRESDVEAEIMRTGKASRHIGGSEAGGWEGGTSRQRGENVCGPREERTRRVEGNESSPSNPECGDKGKEQCGGETGGGRTIGLEGRSHDFRRLVTSELVASVCQLTQSLLLSHPPLWLAACFRFI